jgi:hypothetical protein
MRLLVTILLALVLSWLGGSAAAVLAADWARGDESFILAFMAIPLAGLVALVVLLVASTRTVPSRAINLAALSMAGLLLLLFAGLSLVELFVNGTLASAWRGVQLFVGIFGSCIVVVMVQWVVFRWRTRARPPAMLFGRGPGAPA